MDAFRFINRLVSCYCTAARVVCQGGNVGRSARINLREGGHDSKIGLDSG